MKKFILGVVVGVLLVVGGFYFYFATGMAPVATAAEAMPFEKKMANMALQARVEKEAPKNAPMQPTEQDYIAGADVYRKQCADCHGLPGQPLSSYAKGEFPKPPQLLKGKGVTDDPAGETYWKVANGIRLTGMPAFKPSLSDQQMWQVSWLLANADKIPESAKAKLSAPDAERQGTP